MISVTVRPQWKLIRLSREMPLILILTRTRVVPQLPCHVGPQRLPLSSDLLFIIEAFLLISVVTIMMEVLSLFLVINLIMRMVRTMMGGDKDDD